MSPPREPSPGPRTPFKNKTQTAGRGGRTSTSTSPTFPNAIQLRTNRARVRGPKGKRALGGAWRRVFVIRGSLHVANDNMKAAAWLWRGLEQNICYYGNLTVSGTQLDGRAASLVEDALPVLLGGLHRDLAVVLQRGRGVLQRTPVLLDGLQHDLAVVLQRG